MLKCGDFGLLSTPVVGEGQRRPDNNNASPMGSAPTRMYKTMNITPYFRIQAFKHTGAKLERKDVKTVAEAVALMRHYSDVPVMCSVMPAGHPDEDRLHEALKRALADGGQIDTSNGLGSPEDDVCIFVGK